MAIIQNITTIPPAGHRGVDLRDDFVTKQEAFQDALTDTTVDEINQWTVEANATATAVNDDQVAAAASETAAATSAGNAATSEGNALTSESNASASESAALVSETNAELFEWEAQAWKLTAESYATEAEDVLVNMVTSDGDGTFTYTPTSDYSATHYKLKAQAYAAALNLPAVAPGDVGKILEVNSAEDGYDLIVGSTEYVRKDQASIIAADLTVDNLITSGDVDGRDLSVDGSKLDNISAEAIAATEYATSTVGGTVKARLDGTTLYITIDGTAA